MSSNNNNNNYYNGDIIPLLLDDCHCCEGIKKVTPIKVENPPGLSNIKYRVGTHGTFKQSMITALSHEPALSELTTRSDNDLAIALLDAWATVGDVITFYQERVANEGFLRTATERRSILELARTIGYELKPGIAASTRLAFTCEDAPGALEKTNIDIGTKVQSLPGQGETPQVFETIEKIEARPEWNNLRPKQTVEQEVSIDTSVFYFKGIDTRLKSGDLLLVLKVDPNTESLSPLSVRIVKKVNLDSRSQLTEVFTDSLPGELKSSTKGIGIMASLGITTQDAKPPKKIVVYGFRLRCGLFGHNAPAFRTLPEQLTGTDKAFEKNWDGKDALDPVAINEDSKREHYFFHSGNIGITIYLDNTYPSVIPNSLIALKDNEKVEVFRVVQTIEKTLADFTLSSKVTGLELDDESIPDTQPPPPPEDLRNDLSEFKLRRTTAFVQSEELEMAEEPYTEAVQGNSIDLDRSVAGLLSGRPVAINGELYNQKGIIKSEIAIIQNVLSKEEEDHLTTLYLKDNLVNKYRRDTVKLNANVADATHGETKEEEVLGSGDPSQKHQEFILKQSPVTFVSSPTPSGARTTLEIRVGGILWKEVPNLYNSKDSDNVYMTRIDNDGKCTVIFNSAKGVRPFAGLENITARYRAGSGFAGNLKEGKLSLLMSRPFGVRGVTNPVPAKGGDDPENLSKARRNAPLTVLTMERLVSLKDFENFALAFSGIGKAKATEIWNGERRIVHLTVASATGEPLEQTEATFMNLVEAIKANSDPLIPFEIQSFEKLLFNIEAKIMIAHDVEPDAILAKVKKILEEKFSFESREFGQPVMLSEVMAIIQQVQGVTAVDVDSLELSGKSMILSLRVLRRAVRKKKTFMIPCLPARWYNGKVLPAQLLVVNPAGIELRMMMMAS